MEAPVSLSVIVSHAARYYHPAEADIVDRTVVQHLQQLFSGIVVLARKHYRELVASEAETVALVCGAEAGGDAFRGFFEKFIAARIPIPYCYYDEDIIINFDKARFDLPEAKAIIEFGKKELTLDDEWAKQLVDDCVLNFSNSLYEKKSWVMDVLQQEQYGKIHFRTVEQVKLFRELGNSLYLVMPNPVLRGWKPTEVDNPPVLLDAIPEKDDEIPDGRPEMDALFAQYGGREKVGQLLMQRLSEAGQKKKKVGRNELCPCGSGKKYKKCCGR